jgi:mono/diheme cytochrome c family protein
VSRMVRRICLLVITCACCWPAVVVASEAQRDLASETLGIFSAKCAGCHGPNLPKPRGRFGYVLDLARVAANPEMVVPGTPEESELWELIRRREMPPDNAPTGPLSDEQKEVIRAWIAAGAPANSILPMTENFQQRAAAAPSRRASILGRLGPFHLVAVHFPIALLISAAFAEFWRALRRGRSPTLEVRFCVLLGAASAVFTASLGWIHASNGYGVGSPETLFLHRWFGTGAAAWALGTAIFSEWDERRGARSQWVRGWLFCGALLVAIEGHFGGMLVHGDDFLSGR